MTDTTPTTTTTLDPQQPDLDSLHPVVRRVVRTLLREGVRWDTLTVSERPWDGRRPNDTWVEVMAERYPGTLASSYVQVFVRTSGPQRAKFVGGHRRSFAIGDRKISTWRDLQVYGW